MARARQTTTDPAGTTQQQSVLPHARNLNWHVATSHLFSGAGLTVTLIGAGLQDGALQAGGVAAMISGSALHLIIAARHPQRHQFSAAAQRDREETTRSPGW